MTLDDSYKISNIQTTERDDSEKYKGILEKRRKEARILCQLFIMCVVRVVLGGCLG